MERRLEGNIWKYGLLLVTNKRIFIAILGAYYLTVPDVNAWWVGAILSAGSIAGFVFEIPSGYVSDKIGHKKALVVARISLFASTLCFLLADNIPLLIVGSTLLSIGFAFHSGTGDAFLHETLRGLKRESEYAKVAGKLSSIGFAVPITFTALVPFLVSISYKLPFLIALVIDVAGLCAAFALVKPPLEERVEKGELTNMKAIVKEGRHLRFFRYALFSGIVGGVVMSAGGFRAPYQMTLGVPVIWFGILHGGGRALASLVLAYSGKVRSLLRVAHRFYRYQIILYALLLLLLGLMPTPSVVIAAFILLNAFQWGLSQVSTGYLVGIIRTSKFKATLLSVPAQVQEAVTAVATLGLGFAIERWSYERGFLYLAIIFLAVLSPLYIWMHRDQRAT